jgi:uncharacterized protein YjiS (DUF1127 family)
MRSTRPQTKEMEFPMSPLKIIARKFGAWRRYRDAVRELSNLNDHELRDIGIDRDDIIAIARMHAAG